MIRLLPLLILSILATAGRAYTQTARFPVEEVTRKEAVDSFSSIESSIKKALRHQKIKICKLGQIKVKCVNGDGGNLYYIPPYRIVPQADYPDRTIEIWAPASSTINGTDALSMWEQNADGHELFDCHDDFCSVFVRTTGVDGVARCSLETMQGLTGAPYACRLLAFRDEGAAFIRVPAGEEAPPKLSKMPLPTNVGRPDFSMRVVGIQCPNDKIITASLLNALKSDPVALNPKIESRGRFFGIASGRPSRILRGWREFISVRLDATECASFQIYSAGHTREMKGYGFTVSTSLYVNRQNTDRPSDWIMPTYEQGDEWVESIWNNLRQALTGFCDEGKWIDKNTLICS